MQKTNLEEFRKELDITQETLARTANIPLSTYRRAEKGKPISFTTAGYVVRALNQLRLEHNLDKVEMSALQLNIV
jgi:DNA-binding XRE family transcriptional regulator